MRPKMLIIVSLLVFLVSSAAMAQAVTERDQGIELYRSGQFAESIAILEKLVASGEADHPSGLYLGAAYVQTGKKKEAVHILSGLRDLKPPMAQLGYESKLVVTSKPQPRFGPVALRSLTAGSIKVLVEFKADGSVGFVFPFEMTSDLLIDGATRAAKSIVFEPAVIAGKPVNSVNVIEYKVARY